MGLLIGYARVSTDDQRMDLQRDALLRAGVLPDNLHEDTASGAAKNRIGLTAALMDCRRGDTLVVWKLDRLGRSVLAILQMVEELRDRGIGLRSLTESIDTSTPYGEFLMVILAGLAQMERALIRERTKAGLQAARERGAKPGQPVKMNPQRAAKARKLLAEGKSKLSVTRDIGVSYTTLHKWLRAEREARALAGSGK